MTPDIPRNLTIAEVRLTPVLISDPPLLNVHGVHQPYTPRLVVEIVTADGVSGIGETYGDTGYLDIARPYAELLPGHSIVDLNGLAVLARQVGIDDAPLDDAVDVGGLRGIQTADKLRLSVYSAFEVACLDALGKVQGLPVHALLGGKVRDTVEYSAYLFYRWAGHPDGAGEPDTWGEAVDPAGIVAQARRFVDDYGFTSFKLKGGVFPPDEEIAAVKALAEAFPGHPLRLDPNGGWTPQTSLKVAAELADVLEYLEDPSPGTPNMAAVSAGIRAAGRSPSGQGGGPRERVPLATNMCVTTIPEIREAFLTDAVQVVLSDHHYWGGLRATRELAAICRTFGVGLSMHSNTHMGISLAAMTHVAATVPNLDYACDSHYPWQTDDVITARHVFTDGRLPVSDAPGLGVTLDRERLAALHRRWLEDDGTMRDRDDAAAMRKGKGYEDWTGPALPRW